MSYVNWDVHISLGFPFYRKNIASPVTSVVRKTNDKINGTEVKFSECSKSISFMPAASPDLSEPLLLQ